MTASPDRPDRRRSAAGAAADAAADPTAGDEGAAVRVRRRDFALHAALFAVVNGCYLFWAWPSWLWVTAIWSIGLGVHASLAFDVVTQRDGPSGGRAGRDGGPGGTTSR